MKRPVPTKAASVMNDLERLAQVLNGKRDIGHFRRAEIK
jgi:hypothetical protein